ncbi:MAG: hypothetical protein B7Z75_09650 [Acidocella sp. 20-57-95]|nr:MAG: hypothetical protein B7Z75_09650 [Acidocella sp. 20-57-95]OYV62057.1 MAG: hypothetical protein B7Z71_02755 [Acidocella sp. 21-58-7]HQT65405.1 CHAP domain-containing protein [Acidocella sp.]HQU04093.1 CHAP domain-containing protein [Acidocella sp.]
MMSGSRYDTTRARQVKLWLFSLTLAAGAALTHSAALAETKQPTTHHHTTASHHVVASHHTVTKHHYAAATTHPATHVALTTHHTTHYKRHYRLASAKYRHSMLQCVPYAREVSHIELSGNAFLWWAEAAGRYARGNTPAEGAVLNFRPTRHMPLGHVAVVTAVIDSRTILTTQANWIPGTITNDVTMEDVSPNNDWSVVQVELGDTAAMGASYPTYGFIYNQPDTGTGLTVASATPGDTTSAPASEVAEAPKPTLVSTDAPNRNLQ